ncbi:TPA: hypothetical protein ACH3X1_014543 [Trebouxia sp. C0004]
MLLRRRSQLSAGQERQEGFFAKAPGVSNGAAAGLVELGENGSVVMGGEEHGPSPLQGSTGASSEDLDSPQALRSISQGRHGPHTGNPFAAGLTPAASHTLPGVELSAVSAATSSVPLLHQGGMQRYGGAASTS